MVGMVKAQDSNSFITTNLLSPVNPLNPRWRVGYIQNLNSNWKLGLDIGYGTKNNTWAIITGNILNGILEKDYQLWEVRPELYYIINPEKKTLQYFSSELFYIHHRDVYHDSFVDMKNGGFFLFDQANFQRQKFGFQIKYGIFTNISESLGLNIYTGLGIRFRNISYTNIINPTLFDDPREIAIDYNEYEGLYTRVNFALGIKLHYRL